ncbi:MAG: PaaI family thioesterase [Burkholderiaceae bacterium]
MPSDSAADVPAAIHTNDIAADPKGPFPIRIPFVHYLGLSLHEFGNGKAVVGLMPQAHHQNTFDMAHGGVVMTMMDICMLMAGRAMPRDDDDLMKSLITIELKTSFMQPAIGDLRALGTCVHRTASMAFCEGALTNETGAILARATGTFKYMKQRKPK